MLEQPRARPVRVRARRLGQLHRRLGGRSAAHGARRHVPPRCSRRPSRRFRRRQLLTEDYVWHEVLASGDADVVEVLLQISVVDRVNTASPRRSPADADVRDLLLRAESQGLFVSSARHRGLVQDPSAGPRGAAQRARPAMGHRECHERAARWFEDSGETVSALDHWLLAERPRDALRLLGASSTELYDQGREAVILRTIAAITAYRRHDRRGRAHRLRSQPHPRSTCAVHRDRRRSGLARRARRSTTSRAQIDGLQAISMTDAGDWTGGSATPVERSEPLGDNWCTDPAGRFGGTSPGASPCPRAGTTTTRSSATPRSP